MEASLTNSKSQSVYIRKFDAPQLVGEIVMFSQMQRHFFSIRFKTDSVMIIINANKFKKNFLSDTKVAEKMFISLCDKLFTFVQIVYDDKMYTKSEKVLIFIYEHRDNIEKISHAEIARELNLFPQSLSRIIRKIKESDVISMEKRKISIKNMDKLKSMLPEDYRF